MAAAISDAENHSIGTEHDGENGIVDHGEKGVAQHVEYKPTYSISEAHRQFLIERHGTTELDPIPEFSDADPYNWPHSKKVVNLLLVAFHAFMATFTAAAIQSAFADISKDFGISIQKSSYLTSLVIAILGVAPLFWRPLSDRFGRRPIFLLSLVCSAVGNIGCAKSPSYGTMGLCRAITAFFISPAAAIGSAVVQETFFKHQRGRYMGVWTMFVTLGVPVAPFLFGFVALRVGYRWIYWILAMINAAQFILYLFFGLETRYIHSNQDSSQTAAAAPAPKGGLGNKFHFGRIDRTPISLLDFVRPLALGAKPCVLIPAVAYSMVFCLSGVLPTIMIPQLYVEEFGFNTQQVGLQFAAVIIGTVVGEQIGGFCSDRWMARRKHVAAPHAEFRLWLSYIGYALAIGGMIVFLVRLDQVGEHFEVSPTVGTGIAAAGNQIVTTVLVTYAVDCYREKAAAIGVFITFVRQTWGFIGPFWFPSMIADVGLSGSAGVVTALMVGASVGTTVLLQWRGARWH